VARKKLWIQDAIKAEGSLTRSARASNALKKDGTIKVSWLREQAKKGNSTIAKRARLALTLRKMPKRGRKK